MLHHEKGNSDLNHIFSPWNVTAQAIFTIFISNILHQSFLRIVKINLSKADSKSIPHVCKKANELPKLIPTSGGGVETTGVSALPFGTALNGVY